MEGKGDHRDTIGLTHVCTTRGWSDLLGRHAGWRDEAIHDMADDNGPDHETAARLRVLHRFIANLEPLNRALLLLYLDERSTREIAEVLGISESNVTTKISRLRQRIRDHVAAPGNE